MADGKEHRRRYPTDDSLPFKNELKPDSVILETLKEFSTSSSSSSSSSSAADKTLTLQNQGCTDSPGIVVGRLIFSDDGDMIDCTKMGLEGAQISPVIDRVGDMQSDALFILLVEKFGPFFRLAQDKVYNRFPCIIVTPLGKRNVATRQFLMKMKMELKLPVLALTDCDPYGLKFLSFYQCGSKSMSNDSAHLTTLDVKWLGVRPTDLDKYKLPEPCRLCMTEPDIKAVKNMLEEDFVKKNPDLVEELTLMVKTKQKLEVEAFNAFATLYLSDVFLPFKLQQKDWL